MFTSLDQPHGGWQQPFFFRTIAWNGRPLRVHPARVSARPLNKVWDGAQRPVEQTALSSFVSFDMEGPGELTIQGFAPGAPENPVLLPLGSAPPWRREGDALIIALDRPQQFVVCLDGGGCVLHVFANPPFAEPREPARLRRFGPGEHHVGVVVPESGETIVIEEGAVVYGAILVANAHDVRIVGRGIVDGSYLDRASHDSAAYHAALAAGIPPGFYGAEMAVTCLTCFASSRVHVEGVVFRDPPRWTVIVRGGSRDVSIDNVKIVGCWRYNSDGINVCTSENVAIRDSFIRSFDDCLIARGKYLEGDGTVTRGVTAERCVLWCDWGKCMEVWAGPYPCLIEGVLFRDMAVIHPSGTVCDVTTWFASSDTRIRDVAFQDVEVDFSLPLFREQLESSPDAAATPPEPRKQQRLLVVNCERYGHYLGNQQFEPASDLSRFRVRYENLAFRRIRCLGDVPQLVGSIDATTTPHTIEGIALESLPPTLRLEIAGSVEQTPNEKYLAKH